MTKESPSRNGDTLADLNAKKAAAQEVAAGAWHQCLEVEHRAKAARLAAESAQRVVDNLSCRLNTWWSEYRNSQPKPDRVKCGCEHLHGEPDSGFDVPEGAK